jgi:hypothetical protein
VARRCKRELMYIPRGLYGFVNGVWKGSRVAVVAREFTGNPNPKFATPIHFEPHH